MSSVAVSSGMSDADFDKLRAICDAIPAIEYVCLDVANGYSEHFVDFIRRVREALPRHTIFAGNVATGEMVEELILIGADVIKVDYVHLENICVCFKGRHRSGISVHDAKEDRRRISATVSSTRMRRRGTRSQRAYNERRRMHMSGYGYNQQGLYLN